MDVSVGISLLISQSCLIIGARNSKIHHILVFLILSVLVIGAYWAWWAGLYYHKSETEASKEVTEPVDIVEIEIDKRVTEINERKIAFKLRFHLNDVTLSWSIRFFLIDLLHTKLFSR